MTFIRLNEPAYISAQYGAGSNFIVKTFANLPSDLYIEENGEYFVKDTPFTSRLGKIHPCEVEDWNIQSNIINIYFDEESRFYSLLCDKICYIKKYNSQFSKVPQFKAQLRRERLLFPDIELTKERAIMTREFYNKKLSKKHSGQRLMNLPNVIANVRWYDLFIDKSKQDDQIKMISDALEIPYRSEIKDELNFWWTNNLKMCDEFDVFRNVRELMAKDNIVL